MFADDDVHEFRKVFNGFAAIFPGRFSDLFHFCGDVAGVFSYCRGRCRCREKCRLGGYLGGLFVDRFLCGLHVYRLVKVGAAAFADDGFYVLVYNSVAIVAPESLDRFLWIFRRFFIRNGWVFR